MKAQKLKDRACQLTPKSLFELLQRRKYTLSYVRSDVALPTTVCKCALAILPIFFLVKNEGKVTKILIDATNNSNKGRQFAIIGRR